VLTSVNPLSDGTVKSSTFFRSPLRLPYLGSDQRLAGFGAEHLFHPLIKASDDLLWAMGCLRGGDVCQTTES